MVWVTAVCTAAACPLSALVAGYAQLRELQRQFVRDLFGLVGRGIVDNQNFETWRNVWKQFQQLVHFASQSALGIVDGQNDAQREFH